jgi:hypothetical protein
MLGFMLLCTAMAQPEPRMLESAEKDLQDIKAAQSDPTRVRVELPKIAGPESPAAAIPLQGQRARESQRTVRGKSENWLLDAMTGTDERTAQEEKLLILTGEKTETELQLEKRFRLPGEKIEQAPSRLSEKSADAGRLPATETAIENPLTAFMGDWISQRDHALLLPKAATGPSSNSPLVSLPAPSGYRGVSQTSITGFSGDVTAANVFSQSTRPAENPYLQTLLPSMPEPPAMRPEMPAFVQPRNDLPAPSLRRQAEPPVPAAKPQVPGELARPEEDKKYFPQLRHF